MPRPPIRDSIQAKVLEYCDLAIQHSPDEMPLTFLGIAARLNVDRRTLKKHFASEIAEAERRRRLNPRYVARARERRAYADMLRDRDSHIEQLRRRNEGLLARLALVEINAARLGINPEELYIATAKPNRSVSRAGRRARS
jgi:hypothetical protein